MPAQAEVLAQIIRQPHADLTTINAKSILYFAYQTSIATTRPRNSMKNGIVEKVNMLGSEAPIGIGDPSHADDFQKRRQ